MPVNCQACHTSRGNYYVKIEGLTYHRFPVGSQDVCKKWVAFCRNEKLSTLPEEKLKIRFICSRHFKRSDYMSISSNRLMPQAVPTEAWPFSPSSDALPHQKEAPSELVRVLTEEEVPSTALEVVFEEDQSTGVMEECLPSFTLHDDVVKLAPDLAVLESMKEELLRTQLNIIIDRVAELRLKCTEEQRAAARVTSPPHDLQLEVQRLERLSVYLNMLLAFLNKWKMQEMEEMKRQAEIKRRMNLFDKLLKIAVNKEPKEPNNS